MKKMKIDGEKVALWAFLFAAVTTFIAIGFPIPTEEKEAQLPEPIEVKQLYDVPLELELQEHINQLCDDYDVDMPLVLAIIGQESNYRPDAVGDNGNSLGLMQIQPRWHQTRMDELGVTDLLDPYQNVTVGIDLLADLMNEGGTRWAIMAYNAGVETADYHTAIGTITEYAAEVERLREEIK